MTLFFFLFGLFVLWLCAWLVDWAIYKIRLDYLRWVDQNYRK